MMMGVQVGLDFQSPRKMRRHNKIHYMKWLYFARTFRHIFNDDMDIYFSKYTWMNFFPPSIIISIL